MYGDPLNRTTEAGVLLGTHVFRLTAAREDPTRAGTDLAALEALRYQVLDYGFPAAEAGWSNVGTYTVKALSSLFACGSVEAADVDLRAQCGGNTAYIPTVGFEDTCIPVELYGIDYELRRPIRFFVSHDVLPAHGVLHQWLETPDPVSGSRCGAEAAAGDLVENSNGTRATLGYRPVVDYFNAVQFEFRASVISETVCATKDVTCLDLTGWQDRRGSVCLEYNDATKCALAASNVNADGLDAHDACCACGGGRTVVFDEMSFYVSPTENVRFKSISGKHPIQVLEVNDPPTLSIEWPLDFNGQPTSGPATAHVLVRTPLPKVRLEDHDEDIHAIAVTLETTSSGNIYIPSSLPLAFANGDGQGDVAMTFYGKPSVVQKALQQMVYEPLDLVAGMHEVLISYQDPYLPSLGSDPLQCEYAYYSTHRNSTELAINDTRIVMRIEVIARDDGTGSNDGKGTEGRKEFLPTTYLKVCAGAVALAACLMCGGLCWKCCKRKQDKEENTARHECIIFPCCYVEEEWSGSDNEADADDDGREKEQELVQMRGPPPPPPPPPPMVDSDVGDWASHVDSESGKMYYYNAKTRQTSWERPLGFGGSNSSFTTDSMHDFARSTEPSQSSSSSPSGTPTSKQVRRKSRLSFVMKNPMAPAGHSKIPLKTRTSMSPTQRTSVTSSSFETRPTTPPPVEVHEAERVESGSSTQKPMNAVKVPEQAVI